MSLVRTPSRRNLAILMAITMLLGAFGATTIPAQAGHGETCLDLTPETDDNPVGTDHTVIAQLRTPTGVPGVPCSQGTAATVAGVVINFDIDGVGELPAEDPVDKTCTTDATGSCPMTYSSTVAGKDTIAGWIDDTTRDEGETLAEGGSPEPAVTTDEPDGTDVVEKNWVAPASTATQLDCEPENPPTNPTGDSHTVTCTATDQYGNPVQGAKVDAEAEGANEPAETNPDSPDYTCTTNAQGQCSFSHGPNGFPSTPTNNEGTTTYRAWLDKDGNDSNVDEGDATEGQNETTAPGATAEPDGTDVVTKQWAHSPLNCVPERRTNPAGTDHTVTCTARGADGLPKSGAFIDAEAIGTNDPDGANSPVSPDFTCTTDANGNCSFTHGPTGNARTGRDGCASPCNNTNSAGTTTYRAWIDEDGNHNTNPQTHGSFEGDAAEGQYDGSPESAPSPMPTPSPSPSGGFTPEPDQTDVVEKVWGASRVDCSPETDRNPTGTSHSLICRASDQNDANVGGTEIDVELTGANDPDQSDSLQTPDITCITDTTGRCTIVHGPGGIGTTNSGGTTLYRAWVDLDKNNASPEADANEGRIETTDVGEPDNTDVVEKTWIASLLDCAPETDTNPAQSAHTITCRTSDSAGAPVAGMQVDVEATGPNDPDAANSPTSPDFSCTTVTDGSCSFTHGPGGRGTTSSFGRTIYRAWIDADNSDATAESDPTEGRDETAGAPAPTPSGSPTPTQSPTASPSPSPTGTPAPSGPGRDAEPDSTDVVEKNWSAVPTRLTMIPETDSAPVGSCNAFTITATDSAGQPVASVVIDVEQRHERSDNLTPNDEPDVSFCVPDKLDGPNPSDVDESRGDLGDGADGATGGEADLQTDVNGKVTIGIRVASQAGSNGTGNVLVTAFYENEDNDDADTSDPQDSSTKTWIASQARTIDCTPETARNRTGTEHLVTCTVRDAAGQPAQSEVVRFTEEGPGVIVSSTQADTDQQGRATVTVSSGRSGTQTITGTLASSTEGEPDVDECERGAGDPQGAPAGQCSDSVEKTWTRAARVKSGPCEGFLQGTRNNRPGGGKVIVGTSGRDVLRGTNDNDIICGLGGKDTLIGREGKDLLDGGKAGDVLRGNDGKDSLRGRADDDELFGGKGDDGLRGGRGSDLLDGGPGTDSCRPGPGRDRVVRCE